MTQKEACKMARAFLFSGMPGIESIGFAGAAGYGTDQDTVQGSIRIILMQHRNKVKAAVKGYLDDGDQDAFFLALFPVHLKIRYEAYAPYWLQHCHPVSDYDDAAEFTYYNDLIDMYWVGEWQEWKRKEKWEVTIMLPPTKGLILLKYREEMRGVEMSGLAR